jgi:hypothetical protein
MFVVGLELTSIENFAYVLKERTVSPELFELIPLDGSVDK